MLRNCIECNRVFSHPTNKLCPECLRLRNQEFEAVREYLREHPNALLIDVVTKTGVRVERIYEFIDEGRLKIVPADVRFRCQVCGAEITSGRICNSCKKQLTSNRDNPAMQTKYRAKMHVLEFRNSQNQK